MSKVYHHRIPGARFIMPNGKEVCFAGGIVDTATLPEESRAAVEAELDKVADQASSMIYTQKPVEGLAEKQALSETRAAAVTAFDTVNKIPAGSRTVPMPMAPAVKPVLSEVSADDATGLDTLPAASASDLQAKIAAAKAKVAGATAAPSISK